MYTEDKYELRSQDAQEVLSSPPRFFIFWGNAIVIVLLLCGLLFLNKYTIIQKIYTPFQLTNSHGTLAIMVDSSVSTQVSEGQRILLNVPGSNTIVEDSIDKVFDTTINMSPKKCLLLKKNLLSKHIYGSGSNNVINGQAEIQVAKTSVLQLFLSKIFKSHY